MVRPFNFLVSVNVLAFPVPLNMKEIRIDTHRKISKNQQTSSQKVKKSWYFVWWKHLSQNIRFNIDTMLDLGFPPSYRTIWMKTTEKGTLDQKNGNVCAFINHYFHSDKILLKLCLSICQRLTNFSESCDLWSFLRNE